ncbi:uncharacterized protein B0I36DRAFT_365754 [Microdochium trichocladiopsis]|uniref:C2H2-type domain-containing protein n=1 Tax=Microdochium trichocladiopsis TaxID=1682393 RepID=A0A9P8XZS4_9PEZI|nr:uncharacterized protein B0I36DRAFT_365754 [Microdochium trichocladiopsis]KAH7026147.1 hypothetical protein B0I36DRAFT_365754 [Microdochium trichocladiopsis]
MAFPGHFPRTDLYEYSDQHFLLLDSPSSAYIEPDLEAWSASTSEWAETKQPILRFLSERDQGPMLFQMSGFPEPHGIPPLPGSYRKPSPPRTTISSTDSCASPPCATDFLQPQTPPITDCISPLLSHPHQLSAGGHLSYTDHADSCMNTFDLDYRVDDSAEFFKLEESNSSWSTPQFPESTQDSWSPYAGPLLKSEVDLGQIPAPTTVEPSGTGTGDELDPGDEIFVNTQSQVHDSPKRSRSQKMSMRSPDGQDSQARKRKNTLVTNPTKRPKTEVAASENLPPLKMGASQQGNNYSCHDCAKPAFFRDEQSLLKHRKAQHTRPFNCVYHFAGCQSTFASKNEWKRHVVSQHLVLHYWICTEGSCAQVPVIEDSLGSSTQMYPDANTDTSGRHGTIFNRKDLYTQHLRRMHVPAEFKKLMKQKNAHVPEWEKQVKEHQKKSQRLRCALPEHMDCPLPTCTDSFHGANAWDERMEHVARHLDTTASSTAGSGHAAAENPTVEFGGPGDLTLLHWSMRPDVAVIRWNRQNGCWELNNPLRTSAGPRKSSTSARTRRAPSLDSKEVPAQDDYPFVRGPSEDDDDRDAEGEDDDGYVI